jgi:predicted RNA methylase
MRIDRDTLVTLSRSTCDGSTVFLPPGQLERKAYVAVNKVLEALGGKWDRKRGGHVFDGSAEERLEDALLTGEVVTHREMGFFRTTGPALDALMVAAEVECGMTVLEPSAGEGDIVRATFLAGAGAVVAIEIDQGRAEHLFSVECPQGSRLVVHHADFLELPVPPVAQFDRVVMNPPFSVPGNRRADLAHVEHAIQFLKPGGRLAAIMGGGIMFRQDRRSTTFRDLVDGMGAEWAHLPAGSFAASGTNVNTALLTLTKDAR